MEKRVGIKVNRNNNMITVKRNIKPVNSTVEKGKVEGLPKDFFETVLDCEVKLKEKFDMKVLQKLIDYYSTAVGYYESINDPKFMIYNQSLSLLFSQPEIKKYLTGGNIKLKLKKENIQKIIQECDKKVTTEKVKNFIRRKSAVDSKKTINKLINKDMDTQTNDFKKRLAEKKKRYRLSTSDMAGSNEVGRALRNMGLNNNLSNNDNKNNKSIDLAQDKDKDFKTSDNDIPNLNPNNGANTEKNTITDGSSTNNIQLVGESSGTNNILDELKKEDLNNEDNKNNNDENNLNDSFEKKLDLESTNNIIPNKNIKFTNKTKFLEKMKLHFDIYSNDYYDHFIKKITDQIIKDYNTNFNELTQTLMDSAVNYVNQEKEMEFLLTTDSDESYKKEIGTIVQQLKDEEVVTKDKLIAENKKKVEQLNDKYMGTLNMIQSGHDLEMLKERFKLDTTKSLNTLVFK